MTNLLEVLLWVDVLRFVIVIWGGMYTFLELRDTYTDRQLLRRRGLNGPLKVVAESNIRHEQLRLLIHVLFLWTAVSSILWPADQTHPHVVRLIFDRFALIMASIALAVKSWLSRVQREDLLKYEIAQKRRVTDRLENNADNSISDSSEIHGVKRDFRTLI